jgi:hypothetical protein
MSVHFPDSNATFIHVPKTGGTSFYEWIKRNIPVYDQQLDNIYALSCVDGAKAQWGDLGTVFTFVRNPYSRLVSMYHYQIKKAKMQLQSNSSPQARLRSIKILALASNGFDYWLECIYYQKKELLDIHPDPSTITVSSWFNGTVPDIVVKTEELGSEFYKIAELLTAGQSTDPLPWINTSEHKPYRDYYNAKTIGWVSEQFHDDLEMFEYTF